MRKLRSLIAASALLASAPATAQQGVPYFPQTIPSGTFVGRLSSGPGPTEAISTTAMLNALFPNGSAAFPFNAASVAYQGSVNGVVTVQAQAAAGTWTLKWPTSQGTTNQCLKTTASGSIATTSWANCAFLDSNNTWSGTQTFNGNLTIASVANFTGTFQKNGVTETFPASGVIVGTSDSQTLTNKSIDAGEVNSGTLGCAREPAMTGDATSSAGTCALAIGANKVTRAMEAQGVARSVVGVAGNATANVADIQGTANQVLVVNSGGTGLGFGQVNLSSSAAATTGAWTAYTATLTPGAGAITTQSSSSAYLQIGKTVFFRAAITVSNVGTASGGPTFNLPNSTTLAGQWACSGREAGVSGKLIQAAGSTSSGSLSVFNYDGTTITWSNGIVITCGGVYEAQ